MDAVTAKLCWSLGEKLGQVIRNRLADPGLVKVERLFAELGWVTDGRVGDAVQVSLKTPLGPRTLRVRTRGAAALYSTCTVPVPARNLTPAAVERLLGRNRGLAVGAWELHKPAFGPAGFVLRHTTPLGPIDRESHLALCMALLDEAAAMDEAMRRDGML